MDKSFVEIKGFSELNKKIKSLANDKVKRKEVVKILGQVANTTVKAARQLAPTDSGIHVRGKVYKRKKRQVRNVVVQENYTTGFARKSIGKKILRKARNPMLVVRPKDVAINGQKKYGGWYVRQMVIRGTKYIKSNPFMDKAIAQTKGRVNADGVVKFERYIQKQINKLNV